MKTISKSALLCIIGFVFIFMGCKKLNIEKELRIDLGNQFNKEFVIIKLDDKVIFSDSATSNPLLGVAEVLVFDYPIGRYEISVTINGIEKKEHFRHKKNRFVYISFDRSSSEITITYPDEKYMYD